MWIDTKYVNLLSTQLERFARKGESLYNCRCPFCGDSSKNKHKARGYVYGVEGKLNFKCHNCGHGTNLYGLISHLDPNLAKQYRLETFKEGFSNNQPKVTNTLDFKFQPKKQKKKNVLDENFTTLDKLADSNDVKKYVIDREIPRESFSRLYYIHDVQKLEDIFEDYKDRVIGNESRLGIPFYDSKGNVVALSCRAIDNNRLRYLTIKISKDFPLIYNLPNINHTQEIYVTEGPIDSMFHPNAVAAGSTDFKKIEQLLPIEKLTYVFDNQPRNLQLMKIIENVNPQAKVVIWPDQIEQKDIKEMILDGYTKSQVLEMIQANTHSGLSLKLALAKWRKC